MVPTIKRGTIAELLDIIASLKNLNKELDEKRKKALSDYYETAVKIEEAQGLIVKLTAQVNHNYENSSMPSSKCIGRKKITNNREKTGKKPGAQAGFYSYGSDHQECMVHIERYLKDSIENEKDLTWNRQMLTLIQEMIHENNVAPAEWMAEEEIAEFEAKYDSIVRTAAKEYEDNSPSDYYRDGYNLYLRIVEYKHNRLLFLSNPLVEPDNNLCERKARILKGKINQAISLRSFEHLAHFCECLSVLDHYAVNDQNNLYQVIKEIFKRPQPKLFRVKSEKAESSKERRNITKGAEKC